jgi:hypothetical protein
MERRHLQEKEKMRKEAAAKIRETKTAMAQLAGAWGRRGRLRGPILDGWHTVQALGVSAG